MKMPNVPFTDDPWVRLLWDMLRKWADGQVGGENLTSDLVGDGLDWNNTSDDSVVDAQTPRKLINKLWSGTLTANTIPKGNSLGQLADSLFTDDGSTPKYNTYTIWHSNNDGSTSGLDADLLDGHDSLYFAVASTLTLLNRDVSVALTVSDKYCAVSLGYVLLNTAGSITLAGDSVLRIEDNTPVEPGSNPRILDATHIVYDKNYEHVPGFYRIGINGKITLSGDSVLCISESGAPDTTVKSGSSATIVTDDNLALNRVLSTSVTISDGFCLEPIGYYKIALAGKLTLAGDSVLRLSEVDAPIEAVSQPRKLDTVHTVYDGYAEHVPGFYKIGLNGILTLAGDSEFRIRNNESPPTMLQFKTGALAMLPASLGIGEMYLATDVDRWFMGGAAG